MNIDLTNLSLRPLIFEDMEILFEWKNDPETRANAATPRVILWEEHKAWVTRVVTCPGDRIVRIFEDGTVPVGLIRMGDGKAGDLELCFTVAPNYRHQGIGKTMVKKFIHEHVPFDKWSQLVLPVREGNIAGERIACLVGAMKIVDSRTVAQDVDSPPVSLWGLPMMNEA